MRPIRALLGVLASSVLTKGRLAVLVVLGAIAIGVGVAVGASDNALPTQAGADLVNGYGLALLAPVVTLVLASAIFGNTVEDGTLVYLWLRPVGRATLALAGYLAAVLVALPAVVLPLVVAAALTGGGAELVVGVLLSSTLGVLGYAGLFVAVGLVVRRALAWGIVYILIWEGFIARAGTSSSQLSVQYYARSLLADLTDVPLRLSGASTVAAVVVPLLAAGLGVAFTAWRLRRMSVA